MDVAARVATADDLPTIAELADEAIAERRPLRGGELWFQHAARPEPVAESLSDDLTGDDAEVIVGTIDGTIVGYGVIRTDTLRAGQRLGVVSDLFTLHGARGVGVGEAMMNALLDAGRARGCIGVDSLALPGDRHTKNFFESFGLVARAIVVHRSLTETGDGTGDGPA